MPSSRPRACSASRYIFISLASFSGVDGGAATSRREQRMVGPTQRRVRRQRGSRQRSGSPSAVAMPHASTSRGTATSVATASGGAAGSHALVVCDRRQHRVGRHHRGVGLRGLCRFGFGSAADFHFLSPCKEVLRLRGHFARGPFPDQLWSFLSPPPRGRSAARRHSVFRFRLPDFAEASAGKWLRRAALSNP